MSFLDAVNTGAELVRTVAGVVRAGRLADEVSERQSIVPPPPPRAAIPGPVILRTTEDVTKVYEESLGLPANEVFRNVVENQARKSLEGSGLGELQNQVAHLQRNQGLEASLARERDRAKILAFVGFALGAATMWLAISSGAFRPTTSTERSRRRRRKIR